VFRKAACLTDTPLPNGDALRGLAIFGQCVSCHGVDTGRGVQNDEVLIGRNQKPLKIAQLRSIPDKLGMDLLGPSSRTGFGLRFDGRIGHVDSLSPRHLRDDEHTRKSLTSAPFSWRSLAQTWTTEAAARRGMPRCPVSA
jgi:hypothetical protein